MLVLNNILFVHAGVYLQYLNSAPPGVKPLHMLEVSTLGTFHATCIDTLPYTS